GSWDGTMRLWDVTKGDELRCFGPCPFYVEGVGFAPDGRHAVSGEGQFGSGAGQGGSGADHGVCLWDLVTGRRIHRLNGVPGKVLQVSLSPDGRRAVFACQDQSVRLWELPELPGK